MAQGRRCLKDLPSLIAVVVIGDGGDLLGGVVEDEVPADIEQHLAKDLPCLVFGQAVLGHHDRERRGFTDHVEARTGDHGLNVVIYSGELATAERPNLTAFDLR